MSTNHIPNPAERENKVEEQMAQRTMKTKEFIITISEDLRENGVNESDLQSLETVLNNIHPRRYAGLEGQYIPKEKPKLGVFFSRLERTVKISTDDITQLVGLLVKIPVGAEDITASSQALNFRYNSFSYHILLNTDETRHILSLLDQVKKSNQAYFKWLGRERY